MYILLYKFRSWALAFYHPNKTPARYCPSSRAIHPQGGLGIFHGQQEGKLG